MVGASACSLARIDHVAPVAAGLARHDPDAIGFGQLDRCRDHDSALLPWVHDLAPVVYLYVIMVIITKGKVKNNLDIFHDYFYHKNTMARPHKDPRLLMSIPLRIM